MIEKSDKNRPEMVQAVLKRIDELKIKHVWMQFTDINGIMKSFGVAAFRLPEVLESGGTFDGSSVSGYGVVEESDMVALPDPSTFAVIPWRKDETSLGRFLCDLYNPDGTRYAGDPRFILQRTIKKAESMGYRLKVAPELEFFLLKENGQDVPTTSDLRGYFDSDPSDESHLIRREISVYAESFPDIKVETTHHEAARSQHEVDIRYADAIPMADATITMKMITKAVAARHQMLATFMPKPWNQHNGSGMHVHQSIWDAEGETNLFYDDKDPKKISQLMRFYIGGQLRYAKEFTAVLNSWPNSFKRLVPGYEAPTYISWGFKNRSMLIRVPNFFNRAKAARCEIRSPDPAGNPYLQFAVLLGTGLEGISKKIDAPVPTEINVYRIPEDEKIKMGIQNLPESLGQALHDLRHSDIMKEILGPQAYKSFLDSKTEENTRYNMQVSEWELKRYSQVL